VITRVMKDFSSQLGKYCICCNIIWSAGQDLFGQINMLLIFLSPIPLHAFPFNWMFA